MIVSTLKVNSGKCPVWGVDVAVHGIYRRGGGDDWYFLRAECPIIENSKLPRWKQNPDYAWMSCKNQQDCPLYRSFQPKTTYDI